MLYKYYNNIIFITIVIVIIIVIVIVTIVIISIAVALLLFLFVIFIHILTLRFTKLWVLARLHTIVLTMNKDHFRFLSILPLIFIFLLTRLLLLT